jgi:beta-fructofuranosidase
VLDAGDAYASNISVDDKGRTILWLWGRTNTPQGKGWGSVLTMPRIISLSSDGYLQQKPAPEFETLRGAVKTFPATSLEKPFVPESISTDCAEIEAEFSGSGTFGLELRRAAEGKPGIVASIQGGYLTLGSSRSFVGNADRYKMRVFLDKRAIEVYVNDGVAAVFSHIEAGQSDLGIAVFGQAAVGRGFGGPPAGAAPASGRGGPPATAVAGGAPSRPAPVPPRLEALKVWPMKGARFSMEHFHV